MPRTGRTKTDSFEALGCIIRSVQDIFDETEIPLRVHIVRTDKGHEGEEVFEVLEEYSAAKASEPGSKP
jgi:uncharacterized protein YfcZ (UPF0381/DUF406 family)